MEKLISENPAPFVRPTYMTVSRYSTVSIATRFWLDGPGIEFRLRAGFSASFQTGTGAQPTSCTMGTGSPSRGVKRPRRGVDHPPPSSVEVNATWPVPGRTMQMSSTIKFLYTAYKTKIFHAV
jgi:hypothetical protein